MEQKGAQDLIGAKEILVALKSRIIQFLLTQMG